MKKILVTGATGYIGGQLVKQLEKKITDCDIYILVRSLDKISLDYYFEDKKHKIITIDSLGNIDFDFIYHIAANSNNKSNEDSVVEDIVQSNIVLSTNLLLYARRKDIPIVLISSYSQYTEHNTYTVSKSTVEEIAKTLNYNKIVFVRLPDVYGPNDNRPKVYNLLKNAIKNNSVLELRDNPEKELNLIHVFDVCDGLISYLNTEIKELTIVDYLFEENIITMRNLMRKLDPTGKHYKFPETGKLKFQAPLSKSPRKLNYPSRSNVQNYMEE